MAGRFGQALTETVNLFPSAWTWYVIGGCLADAWLDQALIQSGQSHIGSVLHDIDVIVAGPESKSVLVAALASTEPRVNRFGNPKVTHAGTGLKIDMWRMEDHNLWRPGRAASIAAAVDRCPLDITAIAWSPTDGRLFDGGCVAAIDSRTIELRHAPGARGKERMLIAGHILGVAYKYRAALTLGPIAKKYVRHVLLSPQGTELQKLFEQKLAEKHRLNDDSQTFLQLLKG